MSKVRERRDDGGGDDDFERDDISTRSSEPLPVEALVELPQYADGINEQPAALARGRVVEMATHETDDGRSTGCRPCLGDILGPCESCDVAQPC